MADDGTTTADDSTNATAQKAASDAGAIAEDLGASEEDIRKAAESAAEEAGGTAKDVKPKKKPAKKKADDDDEDDEDEDDEDDENKDIIDLPAKQRKKILAKRQEQATKDAELAEREKKVKEAEDAAAKGKPKKKADDDDEDDEKPFTIELKSDKVDRTKQPFDGKNEEAIVGDITALGKGMEAIGGMIQKMQKTMDEMGKAQTTTSAQAEHSQNVGKVRELLTAGVAAVKEKYGVDVDAEDLAESLIAFGPGIIKKNGGKMPKDFMLRVFKIDPDNADSIGDGGGDDEENEDDEEVESSSAPRTLTKGLGGGKSGGKGKTDEDMILADLEGK